jgi:ATP-dependent Clp protease protease subunit
MQYTVQSSLSTDSPIMLINKHIGKTKDNGMGIDGQEFQRELLELDSLGKKSIQVWINSPGGVVMDGFSIYNAILKSNTPVDTYNVGIAASIAGVIFMAGRKRIMADYSSLMMHNPFGGDDNAELEVMRNSLGTMLSAKCHLNDAEVLKLMKRTTWMGATEAFEKGFATGIEITSQHNKKRMPTEVQAMWKQSNLIINSLIDNDHSKKNTMSFTKITNALGLQNEASEEAISASIANLLKAKNDCEDAAAKAKAEMEDALNKAKIAEEKYNSLVKEKEEAENKAKKAAEEVETEKAKNMVENFVKIGKIKADASEKWITAVKTVGHEEVKAMLEELPVNKTASTIENKLQSEAGELAVGKTYNAAVVMASIASRKKK